MAEKNLFSKVFMIIFLILIVVGFTFPVLFNAPEDSQKTPEPRICKEDSDCYLFCDEKPLPVLCSQNLCQQNTCDEISSFPFEEKPVSFLMDIEIEKKSISFHNRTSGNNLFVKFEEVVSSDVTNLSVNVSEYVLPYTTKLNTKVTVFSSNLNLGQILHKAGIILEDSCLTIDGESFCSDNGHNLTFYINGKEDFSFDYYFPKERDQISIIYN